MEPKCCEPKQPERSESVNIVFDMIRDLMWKIRDVDGIEKQQSMAMQLFKFLGNAKDLQEIATKLMGLAMSADKKTSEEEKKEESEENSLGTLEDLYVNPQD